MLLTSLALAGVVTPSSEPGLWTEPLRAAGLDPAAQVTIDAIDQGYRVHVWVSGGERLAIVTGPHDAATREDAARLARSLLVTARDPLEGMLPAPAPAAPPPAAPKTTRSPPRSEPPPPPAPILAPPAPALVPDPPEPATTVAAPDPAPPTDAVSAPPARTEAPLTDEERAALDADAEGIARPAAPDRTPPPAPRLDLPAEPPIGPRSRVTLALGTRDELLVGEAFDGLAAALRLRGSRTLSAELDAYAHLASDASTRAAADAELEAVATVDSGSRYQVPLRYDTFAVDLLADWSIVPLAGRWAGGPHVQAGVSVRGQQHVQGRVEDGEPAYADAGMVLVPSLSGAIAMEGWYADRVGLRARILGRLAYEEEPYRGEWELAGIYALDPVLTPSAVLTFDLLVHL